MCFIERQKMQKKLREQEADLAKMLYIITEIKKNPDTPPALKAQLDQLIEHYDQIDKDIAGELQDALASLKVGNIAQTAFGLAKIIENILYNLYHQDPQFIAHQKKPTFAHLIEYAKQQQLFSSKEDIAFIDGLRELRNKVAHEPNQNQHKHKFLAGLHIGLDIIFRFVRPKQIA